MTLPYEPIRVRFDGQELWWLKMEDGTGPLAPLYHLDENLEIRSPILGLDTYAHVKPGGLINRHGNIIGTVDDLEYVTVQ